MKIYVLINDVEGFAYHAFKAKPTVEDLISIGIDRDDAIDIINNDHSSYFLEFVTLHSNIKKKEPIGYKRYVR